MLANVEVTSGALVVALPLDATVVSDDDDAPVTHTTSTPLFITQQTTSSRRSLHDGFTNVARHRRIPTELTRPSCPTHNRFQPVSVASSTHPTSRRQSCIPTIPNLLSHSTSCQLLRHHVPTLCHCYSTIPSTPLPLSKSSLIAVSPVASQLLYTIPRFLDSNHTILRLPRQFPSIDSLRTHPLPLSTLPSLTVFTSSLRPRHSTPLYSKRLHTLLTTPRRLFSTVTNPSTLLPRLLRPYCRKACTHADGPAHELASRQTTSHRPSDTAEKRSPQNTPSTTIHQTFASPYHTSLPFRSPHWPNQASTTHTCYVLSNRQPRPYFTSLHFASLHFTSVHSNVVRFWRRRRPLPYRHRRFLPHRSMYRLPIEILRLFRQSS